MNLGRLITAMVTPFDKDLNVDYDQAVRLAKKLEGERSSALVINGTTGESPTLTSEEVYRLLSEIKKNVSIPVIAGVGTNNTKKTIDNINNIKDLNVDGLLVITPYYNKPNQESLYAHFKAVAESTDLPIIIYNVPGRTGVNISVKTVKKLAEIKNIAGIKEASGDMAQFTRMINETPEDFLVYSGDDILTLPCLSVGGNGIVSVASNVAGVKMGEMIDAFENSDMKKAAKINLELTNLFDGLFVTTSPIPVKHALNILGFNVGGYRLPLTEPTPEVSKVVKECLAVL
ncbi:4-hydroxy-tetrahydrodipicolinate synthase [bioreactor metagenome]|jgi:4-hydroxy-tetrahydrodipicolinate synthase|uniref:4-hydroxy-tetrahydrodipicolinate synthase n=2 Tax=root TaxID=1 RepID=A0A562JE26_9FIRM|nr:4-hydroxy-tetrahydrodipicolinate synthase [Sedimentibacter saalensis]MEA5094766.1 4-hydroxy-tetrahydrodipicolinate synthase [Sedimentibacter saalensis]TWH81390.1 dihydrodipicolinate synthase [Sedimentibacter saalensis]